MKNNLFKIIVFTFISCSSGHSEMNTGPSYSYDEMGSNNNESYLELNENEFIETSVNNKVNVSLDSSTAAYSNIRKLINNNRNINKDAVNIEQMLNYFNYSYVNDTENQLASYMELSSCPWNNENYLLSVAVKAKDYVIENKKPNNFVFLLDVSGSMNDSDKLPLMINAFRILVDNLGENDTISIVTYASGDKVLLDGAKGYEKTKIDAIITDLYASGSTAGSRGIQTAYELAEKHFIEGGNNRVFLATDGDFNVGISNTNGLKDFISQKRQSGVYLSVFGFGRGNIKADKMDTLAQSGNGNYYYIDSILEAQKVFVNELGGTLQTVAKDAKVQVEFSDLVKAYRVIGYENKILTNDQFDNNETDAGEIGAGHITVCLIEVKLNDMEKPNTDYFAKCTVRYKDALDYDMDKEITNKCSKLTLSPSDDFLFQSSVCEFGLILRDSKFKANADLERLIERINKIEITQDVYKKEFIDLVLKYLNDYTNN